MTDKKRMQVYVKDEIYNIIVERAQNEGRSVSNYLEQIIIKACSESTPEANKAK